MEGRRETDRQRKRFNFKRMMKTERVGGWNEKTKKNRKRHRKEEGMIS